MADLAKCKSCGREIIWARSKSTGTLMPLTAEPTMDGNIIIDAEGMAVVLTKEAKASHGGMRHISHFADCPNGPAHRKAKAAE